MPRSCYLCGSKNISLHRFPKNPQILTRWIKACGLSNVDDVSRIYICSRHFRDNDIESVLSHKSSKGLHRLIPGSVPTIDVPNPTNNESSSSMLVDVQKPTSSAATKEIDPSLMPEAEVNNSENDKFQENVEVMSTSENAVHNVLPDQPTLEVDHDQTAIIDVKPMKTPKKRKFAEPRYVSEISPSDVATPNRARKVINFVKKNDEKKARQIKLLQDKNRRLVKRITSLQEMMSHLRNKGLMSEEAGDTLMVQYILD